MERLQQSDLFSAPSQGDLFGAPPPVSYAPKPETMRRKMLAMLGLLRGAEECPWSEYERPGLNKANFPRMADWLPEEEARGVAARVCGGGGAAGGGRALTVTRGFAGACTLMDRSLCVSADFA